MKNTPGRIASHIRGNLIGYLALFVALSGTAYAVDGPLPGRNQVGSEDIINGEVRLSDVGRNQITSAHVANDNRIVGGLFSEDIANGALRGVDIDNNTLTSAEIKESAVHGLDDCPSATTRYGRICVEAGGGSQDLAHAFEYCANRNLRLPTVGEAVTLARNYDIPNVNRFWTDGFYFMDSADGFVALAAYDDVDPGSIFHWPVEELNRTVCVIPPFN